MSRPSFQVMSYPCVLSRMIHTFFYNVLGVAKKLIYPFHARRLQPYRQRASERD